VQRQARGQDLQGIGVDQRLSSIGQQAGQRTSSTSGGVSDGSSSVTGLNPSVIGMFVLDVREEEDRGGDAASGAKTHAALSSAPRPGTR
jgi:hypothetical protein